MAGVVVSGVIVLSVSLLLMPLVVLMVLRGRGCNLPEQGSRQDEHEHEKDKPVHDSSLELKTA